MTKNIKSLIVLLIVTLAGAVGASAQAVSLADIGHYVYTSESDGFEIALPRECVKMSANEYGRDYSCNIKEGLVSVSVEVKDPAVRTDADVANFLTGFRGTLQHAKNVKVLRETPVHLGKYRGAAFELTIDGDKAYMTTLCWNKTTINIAGRALSAVPNSGKLIGDAVKSFALKAK